MELGELDRLFAKIDRLHSRRTHFELTKIGLSQGQPRILRYLSSHEGCIQRELSENCHLEPASVTSILEKMERDGLIDRQYEPGGRRSVQVFLTSNGLEARRKAEKAHQIVEEDCFFGFSSKEKEQIQLFMERISDNLMKVEGQISE